MWRVNKAGRFNVAYGGEDRHWAISQTDIKEVAKRLHGAQLKCSDFETVIDTCNPGDFIYADPPYSPGELEPRRDHYIYSQFTFRDHKRLASALRRATKHSIRWALTTSSHPSIVGLFKGSHVISFSKGTSRRLGILEADPGEVLICNYDPWEVQ
jgi:DNA adenine methylase